MNGYELWVGEVDLVLLYTLQHLCSASEFERRQHGHGEPMNWKTGSLRLVKNQFRLYLIVCL